MTSRPIESHDKVILAWHYIDGRLHVLAYRQDGKELIWPFTRYMLYVSNLPYLNEKTIRDEAFKLKGVFEYLGDADVEIISDQWIKSYREYELQHVLDAPNSRGEERTAKRTVNAKLRVLYSFAIWYQWSHPGIAAFAGPIAQITINMPRERIPSYINRAMNGHHRPHVADRYFPLLYKNAGEHSLNRRTRAATEKNIVDMRVIFKTEHTEFTALRNILLMEIANKTGMRRASMNSLRCVQFEQIYLGDMKDILRVVPDVQKFNRDNVVEFPRALVLDIAGFIAGPRADFLAEMGWNEKRTQDRIFISARDGRPLNDQTISDIFGDAARRVGIAQGHAIHMFRFKYVDDQIVEEIELRLKLNLDTNPDSIAMAVAVKLGWKNVETLKIYVSRTHSQLLLRSRSMRATPDGG